jgi:hypothetical protein
MPTIDELKTQLKELKKTHSEIRVTGLTKSELVALVAKYTKTTSSEKPVMAIQKKVAEPKKVESPKPVVSSVPTINKYFTKDERSTVIEDGIYSDPLDLHEYSFGFGFPLEESSSSIIPTFERRKLKLNYAKSDLSRKISSYLITVINYIKSNSVKSKKGDLVFPLSKYELLLK